MRLPSYRFTVDGSRLPVALPIKHADRVACDKQTLITDNELKTRNWKLYSLVRLQPARRVPVLPVLGVERGTD